MYHILFVPPVPAFPSSQPAVERSPLPNSSPSPSSSVSSRLVTPSSTSSSRSETCFCPRARRRSRCATVKSGKDAPMRIRPDEVKLGSVEGGITSSRSTRLSRLFPGRSEASNHAPTIQVGVVIGGTLTCSCARLGCCWCRGTSERFDWSVSLEQLPRGPLFASGRAPGESTQRRREP